MTLKQQLINALPPMRNHWQLIEDKQDTADIISEVLAVSNAWDNDYDVIYDVLNDNGFLGNKGIYEICKKWWEFQKNNLEYVAEGEDDQSVRSPAAILQMPDDCKHFALFTGGLLSAIQRNERGVKWQWWYRFASDKSVNNVSHVFVVVFDQGKEIWIDPCLSNFDYKKKYLLIEDKEPMALYRITGVTDDAPKTVVVGQQEAFEGFCAMMGQDMFSLKKLMRENNAITNGVVRQWFINNGFNWNVVVNYINS